jgi:hypothetical protein
MKYDKYYVPTVDLGIRITKEDALKTQDRHIRRYEEKYPQIREAVAKITTAHLLEDGKLYDIATINKHIPRGVEIDRIIDGMDGG